MNRNGMEEWEVNVQQRPARENHHLVCPECGAKLVLRSRRDGKWFYGCEMWMDTKCDGGIGAHPDGTPLGIPANKETKKARVEAHRSFDRLCTEGKMSKGKAYKWMKKTLQLANGMSHIAMMTKSQCEALVAAVDTKLGKKEQHVDDR
jgi:ssDNA-binding Zn-finger/Zn-ribbon topoisomerase 1